MLSFLRVGRKKRRFFFICLNEHLEHFHFQCFNDLMITIVDRTFLQLPGDKQPGRTREGVIPGIQVQGWYKEIVAKTIVRMQRNVGNFVRDFWRFLEAKRLAVPLSCHGRLLFDQKQTTAEDNLSDMKLRIEIE